MYQWIKRFFWCTSVLLLILIIAITALFTFGPISSFKVGMYDLFGLVAEAPSASIIEQRLVVPEGFSIGKYATGLNKARFLAFTKAGDLLVTQPWQNQITLLSKDKNHDGQHDGERILIDQLNRPQGLGLYQGYLYIAESNAIGRIEFDSKTGELAGSYDRVIKNLPDTGNHWGKSLRIYDDKLYISIGSSCNACEETDKRRATIMQFNLDGTGEEIFATGLRNSVGMDFTPWDGKLYATDNGRDFLGDEYPICELNQIQQGSFYGWPYINAYGDMDPYNGADKEHLLERAISPVFGFNPHNAPLGITFLQSADLPDEYQRSALVALHGSWNRRKPDGYKVISLHWQNNGAISSQDFVSGFEKDGNVIGRPVDIVEGPDGCAYISDDYAGTIYRVCYGVEQTIMAEQPDKALKQDTYLLSLSKEERHIAAKKGKAIYQNMRCSTCHSINGEGNNSGKALERLSHRYTSRSLATYFLLPTPPMPQYSLTEQQRLELSLYLLSVKTERQPTGQL